MIFAKLLFTILIVSIVAIAVMFWIDNKRVPTTLGVKEGKLSPCSSKPNCVSSQSDNSDHHTEPLNVKGINRPLEKIKSIVLTIPKTSIVTENNQYLHVIFRSKLFSFIDDTEFYYDKDREVIQIRSAARVGYSDLGVNRKRVEWIRSQLSKDS